LSQANITSEKNLYWNGWITFAFGMAIMAAYILVSVFLGIIIGIIELRLNPQFSTTNLMGFITDHEGLIASLTGITSAIIGVGLIIIFIKVKNGLSIPEYLGLKHIRLKTVLGLIGLTALLLILSTLSSILFKIPSNNFDEQIYRTSIWPPLLWITLVICAPIFEESFFRGFLFEGLIRSKLGPPGTIILTALVWASLHLQYGIFEISNIFILGIILGIVRYRTGSLWATLLMHAGWNLAVTIQLALTVGNV
jgi:uncharacterized protein